MVGKAWLVVAGGGWGALRGGLRCVAGGAAAPRVALLHAGGGWRVLRGGWRCCTAGGGWRVGRGRTQAPPEASRRRMVATYSGK